MKNYQEMKNLKFGEVVTAEQFKWLNEIVFLSALEEAWSSGEVAHRKEGEGPYPEQFELLNQIFGMSPQEFEERLESFEHHIKRKDRVNEIDHDMNQITVETIETADSWIDLSNQKDLKGLSEVTSHGLELIGPKSTGVINLQELGEWLDRANLKLATIDRYAKDHFIVLKQNGTWLNDDNTIKGQAIVFTVFKVVDRKVNFLARYDNKEEAFKISGLNDGDKIN